MNQFLVCRIANTKDESTLVGCIGQPSQAQYWYVMVLDRDLLKPVVEVCTQIHIISKLTAICNAIWPGIGQFGYVAVNFCSQLIL